MGFYILRIKKTFIFCPQFNGLIVAHC